MENTENQHLTAGRFLSDRLVDGCVAVFASWTLACHISVLLKGSTYVAMPLFLFLCALIWYVLKKLRSSPPADSGDGSTEPDALESDKPIQQTLLVVLYILLVAFVCAIAGHKLGNLKLLLLGCVFCLCCGTPFILKSARSSFAGADNYSMRIVWILAVLVALLTLVAHRPDLDDCFHINMAVTVADQPGSALMSQCPVMFAAPKSFWLTPPWQLHSLEVGVGVLSLISGISAIRVSHFLVPPFAGLLCVLAMYRLLRHLLGRSAHWALLGAVSFLLADGYSNVSYGNFAGFIRLYHGNVIFFAGMVPLIAAYSIEFGLSPSRERFSRLVLAQVASIGLTSTAIWAAPTTAGLALLSAVPFNRRGIKLLTLGGLACFYPLLAGIVFARLMHSLIAKLAFLQVPDEMILLRSFHLAIGNTHFGLTILFFILVAWIVSPTRLCRRFCVTVPAVFILALFNPLTIGFVARHFIGPSIHYRTLMILQAPILIGIALAAPLYGQRQSAPWWWGRLLVLILPFVFFTAIHTPSMGAVIRFKLATPGASRVLLWNGVVLVALVAVFATGLFWDRSSRRMESLVFIVLLAAFYALMPLRHVLAPSNATHGGQLRVGRPALKVHHPAWDAAKVLHDALPAGTSVLAPNTVSAWLPTFQSPLLPVLARFDHLDLVTLHMGQEEAKRREGLVRMVQGQMPAASLGEQLPAALDDYAIKGLCFAPGVDDKQVEAILTGRGFKRLSEGPGQCSIWIDASQDTTGKP